MPDPRNFPLDYRPDTYWNTPAARFANVKGERRRQTIQRAVAEGGLEEMPAELRADILSPELQDQVGRIHPSFMGGEYLPDYPTVEVEIARVALRSTTGDVTSIRARKVDGRIRYRVVDEYDCVYRISPASSLKPLTLQQLIQLSDTASDETNFVVGLVAPHRDPDAVGPDLEIMAEFVRVSSPFYSELEGWYAAEFAEWLERKREQVEEAKTYTAIKHGDKALRKYKSRLTGAWKLIAKGETSEAHFRRRVLAFYLGKSADGSLYALRLDDHGDPNELTKKGVPRAPRCRVVAVIDGPRTDDENAIVRRLLATYRKHGGKWIDGCYERGPFALDPDLPDIVDRGPLCPFCQSDGSCAHLLAYVDETFGTIGGGAFFDHQGAATAVLSEAIEAVWKRLCNRPPEEERELLDSLGRYSRLGRLVEEVFEQKGEGDGEQDLCSCTRAFTNYLDEVFGGGVDVDDDPGLPGMASLCRVYWDRTAKSAARRALKTIRDDARVLRHLASQRAKKG
jgi:hypothetical protein